MKSLILVLAFLSVLPASAESSSRGTYVVNPSWGAVRKLNLHSVSYLTDEKQRVLYGLDRASMTVERIPANHARKPGFKRMALKEAAEKMTSQEMTNYLLDYSLTVEGNEIQIF